MEEKEEGEECSFRQLNGSILEEYVLSGAIGLLDAYWIISQSSRGILPPRQEIPPQAFLSLRDLETADDYRGINIVALSYMWLTKSHPDPDGSTLQLVARALEIFVAESYHEGFEIVEKNIRWGVFWDYASLYQHPRDELQNKLFEKGLMGMPLLYAHPDTTVFRVTELPPHLVHTKGHNVTPYMERGWPFVETCLACLVKDPTNVFDLCRLHDTTPENYTDFEDLCAFGSRRTPPQVPQVFNQQLQGRKFSNGKKDHDRVQELYLHSFVPLLESMTVLDYCGLGWNDADAEHLVEVLRGEYLPNLQGLFLAQNQLGIGFCQSLDDVWNRTSRLVELDLSVNEGIGDEGVLSLLPNLFQLQIVWLRQVGLTAAGCRAIAEIEGEILWVSLHLNMNKISEATGLIAIVKKAKSLRHLNVGRNPLEDSMADLIAVCDAAGIDGLRVPAPSSPAQKQVLAQWPIRESTRTSENYELQTLFRRTLDYSRAMGHAAFPRSDSASESDPSDGTNSNKRISDPT